MSPLRNYMSSPKSGAQSHFPRRKSVVLILCLLVYVLLQFSVASSWLETFSLGMLLKYDGGNKHVYSCEPWCSRYIWNGLIYQTHTITQRAEPRHVLFCVMQWCYHCTFWVISTGEHVCTHYCFQQQQQWLQKLNGNCSCLLLVSCFG